MIHKIWYNIR